MPKIGDIVEIHQWENSCCWSPSGIRNQKAEVTEIKSDGYVMYTCAEGSDLGRTCSHKLDEKREDGIPIINLINNNSMSLKEKFASLFINEPHKTFRKVGITNGDNMLTTEGQEVFLSWLLNKHGDEFKTEVADKMVEETTK